MSILVVVAHPDDEVLGCGGMMAAMSKRGVEVRAVLLSGKAEARRNRPGLLELKSNIAKAQKELTAADPILGGFPNIKFNTVPHLEIVQFIENAILETKATTIFTHHPCDLNNDHLQTVRACLAASRLYQRREGVVPLKALYYMETPSATDWSYPGLGPSFRPDTFFCIENFIEKKVQALAAYVNVMREPPHPRSEERLRALAMSRGCEAGLKYAEAFQTAFRIMEADDRWQRASIRDD